MTTTDLPDQPRISAWRRRHNLMGWLYILPAMLLLGVMVAYPILRSFYLSFFEYSIVEPDAARFVGVGNYVKLATQSTNRGPFLNTLRFTIFFVPPYVIVALIVAVMLNAIKRGSVFLRTMIFTPVVVSLAVSSVMFWILYQQKYGAIDKLLRLVLQGYAPDRGVLGDPAWAMWGIVLLCFWNGVGINIILFLVGLQRIPEELYEAAVVDGAGPWQRFVHVTLPQLRPTMFLVVLLSVIGALKIFGQPYIMTGGGPEDATQTYVMRLYKLAFEYGQFRLGYASALAYTLAAFIFVASLFMRKLNRPVD